MDQQGYLGVIGVYVAHFALPRDRENLHRQAPDRALWRGTRSRRTAWQFVQDHLAQAE